MSETQTSWLPSLPNVPEQGWGWYQHHFTTVGVWKFLLCSRAQYLKDYWLYSIPQFLGVFYWDFFRVSSLLRWQNQKSTSCCFLPPKSSMSNSHYSVFLQVRGQLLSAQKRDITQLTNRHTETSSYLKSSYLIPLSGCKSSWITQKVGEYGELPGGTFQEV